ncbi:Armadillo-like helical [Corchorus capsularis]|uniref:non-specific serine/threonine protein kinase n=1 Tax=Corchorus capsularis TaxID=210143 RepID=A0A1R3J7I3_COCAP|nr:Armadillo-like helical [Corchorus capsularis]
MAKDEDENILCPRFQVMDQDILHLSLSLRILSNLVAAGALHSGGILDEIQCELLNFTAILVGMKSSDVIELVAKSFAVIRMLLAEDNRSDVANSYFKHWVVLVEIFSQVVSHIEDSSACEACRAIWSLMDALDILFMKENSNLFPLDALRSHSLVRLDIRDDARGLLAGTESAKVVDAVTRAFVRSKAVQFAIAHCLHQRVEPALSAAIQILSRCCLHNGIIPTVLCGLPNSLPVTTVVSGGADGTIVSELFSILSLCSSLNKDGQPETADLKCKISNPSALTQHSCLLLATIAQLLKSTGRNSALFMLTTSPQEQLCRLSVLAHHVSCNDTTVTSLQPHSASAMLTLASILSLEGVLSVESSIPEIAMPLIPPTSTLCDHLKILLDSENEVGSRNLKVFLSYWHGLRDGCVGLLESKLRWGGPLAVQQLIASGTPQLLIQLLATNHSNTSHQGFDSLIDGVSLSPVGVVWAVSSICHCLSECSCLPLATAFVNSGFILNMGSPGGRVCMEDKDMVKAIEEDMGKYIKILLEVGVTGIVLGCLEQLESKDLGRAVAFLAKMIGHRPLAVQLVGKGLLDPNRMRRYNMIGLLIDRCADPDKRTRKFACFATGNGNAAYHNDMLYEELKRSIPQLSKLLLSAEDQDKTKANAAGALSNLVRNSNKLCEEIISKGAMQALLKLVADCSVVALKPTKINESPLKIALLSLANMCTSTMSTVPPFIRVVPSDWTASAIPRIKHCKTCLSYCQQSYKPEGEKQLIRSFHFLLISPT